jgi:hypothetical protein
VVGLGELLLPSEGFAGLLTRGLFWLAYPVALFATGFFTTEERGWLARLRHPGELRQQYRAARQRPAAVDGRLPETYEAEIMDQDARP